MNFAFICKEGNEGARACALENKEWLERSGHTVLLNRISEDVDYVFVFGGDGTIIHAAHKIVKKGLSIPMVRVNFGELGFLANVDPADLFDRLAELIYGKKNFTLVEKPRIKATILQGGKKIVVDSMNDVWIEKIESWATTFTLKIKGKKPLRLKANGIIFATHAGSTAYNLSAGGKTPDREDQMVATMICPTIIAKKFFFSEIFNLKTARFEVSGFEEGNARLSADGSDFYLSPDDVVVIEKSENRNIFLEFKGVIC